MFHTSHAMPTGMVLMPKIQIKDNTQNKSSFIFVFYLNIRSIVPKNNRKPVRKMKQDVRRIALAAVIPLFLIFILYLLKFLEVGMDWDFRRLGVYPMEQRGVFGIFAHLLVHGSLRHLLANTLPLFFLSGVCSTFTGTLLPIYSFAIWIGLRRTSPFL